MTAAAGTPSPYPGLRAFTADDYGRFFARKLWTKIVVSNVVASRLTLLFGESGVGKTSLLQAGVEHELLARNGGRAGSAILPIVFRAWRGEPVEPLMRAVHEAARASGEETGEAPRALAEALRACAERAGGRVVLILDQFEEYLLYHGHEEGPDSLPWQLARVVDEPGLPASVLISIREDALSRLDPLKRAIPHLFDNALHLERVDQKAAKETITGPIDWYNDNYARDGQRVEIDEDLVREVLRQVTAARAAANGAHAAAAAGAEDGPVVGESVEFAYLQLVLERLWDEARREGLRRLSISILDGFPGGADEIVRDHVTQAVSGLSEDGRDVAAEAFRYLVTPSGAKIAYTVADLAKQTGADAAALERVIERLCSADARVLRRVQVLRDGGLEPGVEIFHDKLADPILGWRQAHVLRRERERARDEAAESGRRRVRRLRWIAGLSVAVVLVLTGVMLWALHQKNVADSQRRLGESRRATTSAILELSQDPQESLATALRATLAKATPDAVNVLRDALAEAHGTRVLRGDSGSVTRVAYFDSGRGLLTASNDGTVRVWDAASGRLRRVLRAGAVVRDIAISPDGALVAAATLADQNGRARTHVWSVLTGRELGPIDYGPREQAFVVAFAPHGHLLASASDNDDVRLWRPGDGRAARLIGTQGGAPKAIQFSPDGRRLVSASSAGTCLWSIRGDSGRRIRTLRSGPTTDASFSHDGSLVLTANVNGMTAIWNARRGGRPREIPNGSAPLTRAVFSPDDSLVATASGDQRARIWDLKAPGPPTVLGGDTGTVNDVEFSSDGGRVVTASQDGTVRVWSVSTGQALVSLNGHRGTVFRATFNPAGNAIASASSDDTARIWNINLDSYASTVLNGGGGVPLAAALGARGRTLTAVFSNGAVETGGLAPRLPLRQIAAGPALRSAAFSGEGAIVVAITRSGAVRVIESATGRLLAPLAARPPVSRAIPVSHGRLVVTVGHGEAQVWNARSGRLVTTLTLPSGRATSATVTGDGRVGLVTGSRGDAGLFQLSGSSAQLLQSGEPGAITAGDFSPDGKLVATAGANGTVRIWNAAGGGYITSLLGHVGHVNAVAFSPDGHTLVSAGRDRTTRIWDVATGRNLAVLGRPGGAVTQAAFSPDGRFVVDLGRDGYGRIWLWGAGGGQLVERLVGGRGLTSARFVSSSAVLATARDGSVRIYDCAICGDPQQLVALARRRLAGLEG
jgi:WD40 repeat protein